MEKLKLKKAGNISYPQASVKIQFGSFMRQVPINETRIENANMVGLRLAKSLWRIERK